MRETKNIPPFTVPMRGSTNCKMSLLAFPTKVVAMPTNSLRGGLKLSKGIKAHIHKNDTATPGISYHISIPNVACKCFLEGLEASELCL